MARVGLGNLTKIVYMGLGEKKRGQNPAKLFEVEQDATKRIAVEAPKVSFRDEDTSEADVDEGIAQHRSIANGASRAAGTPSADKQARLAALIGKR